MANADHSTPVLVMPRRNFLIRALGFTAAGASMTLPIVTMESPRSVFAITSIRRRQQ